MRKHPVVRSQAPAIVRIIVCGIVLVCACRPLAAASRTPVRSRHGMVVSAHRLASDVGVKILRSGGNAADAAVAVGFALAVVYPEAGNIGGCGFLLIRKADGTSAVVDFRSVAPAGVNPALYIDSAKKLTNASVLGHKAVCVPGTVAGLYETWKRYGSLKFSDLLEPAIELAEKGFPVDRRLEHAFASSRDDLLLFPPTARLISHGGEPYREGDTLRLPDLASTLRRIQRDGRDGFYRGPTADMIVREMERGGGLIRHADLESYEPVVRKPVEGTYRGYGIIGPSLPSSGGICLVELLNILEKFDLAAMGYHSSRAVHCMTEAMKRVFADRAALLGDPDFSRAPVDRLISKEYGRDCASKIDTLHDMPASSFDEETHGRVEGRQTTHYAVVDDARTVVSVTYTLNDMFGSKVVPEGTGFFLNDDVDDFSIIPDAPNLYGLTGSDANALAPHKRPLSSMSPTIVLKNGSPILTLGARGGPRIITAVTQAILNVVDFGMQPQEAVDAPRFHHQWLPDTLEYEKYAFPADVMNNLAAMGHRMKESDDFLARMEAIAIDPEQGGWLSGVPDPRESGEAAGY